MYGYVYLTHDSLNNMYYIGQHKFDGVKYIEPKTVNEKYFLDMYEISHGFRLFYIDPKYIGSGIKLQQAIKKYGKRYFYILDILGVADTKDELDDLEQTIISEYRHLGYNLYNVAKGGSNCRVKSLKGKNNPMYGKHHTDKTKKLISEKTVGRKPWNKGLHNVYSKETLKELSESHKKLVGEKSVQLGRKRTTLSKNKMSLAKKNMVWVYKGSERKGVFSEKEISLHIDSGYSLEMTKEFHDKVYSKGAHNKGKKFNKESGHYE